MRNFLLTLTLLLKLSNITAQNEGTKLKISPLVGNFYIYTTYNTYEGNSTPANGMYLITNNGVVLFDTPWDTTQFQPLLDSIQTKHQKQVIACIATHWHSDRTEGLEYYKQKGINTYTTVLTDELSKKNNKKRAAFLILNDTTFNFNEYTFETFYPGKGHTEDNIVLWFAKQKILYGGCLIKGAEDTNLGYLGDGDVLAYHSTLKNVAKKYPNPEYIIVSHHNWNSKKSLQHSIKMAKKLKRRSKK
jgi:metallo-beta-lactamase class B